MQRHASGWGDLQHAYGAAGDIPALLDALEACEPLPGRWQDEPLGSLWQALCHQGGTFDASYAAVPHLVAIAAPRSAAERAPVLHLVGSIAACQPRGALVPEPLLETYRDSLPRAAELIVATLAATLPPDLRDGLLLIADLAACRGAAPLARAIMALEPGEVDVRCSCGVVELLGVAPAGLAIEPLRWSRRPAPAAEAPVTAGLATFAAELGLAACARVLTDLGGSLWCGSCGGELDVLVGIERFHRW